MQYGCISHGCDSAVVSNNEVSLKALVYGELLSSAAGLNLKLTVVRVTDVCQ